MQFKLSYDEMTRSHLLTIFQHGYAYGYLINADLSYVLIGFVEALNVPQNLSTVIDGDLEHVFQIIIEEGSDERWAIAMEIGLEAS